MMRPVRLTLSSVWRVDGGRRPAGRNDLSAARTPGSRCSTARTSTAGKPRSRATTGATTSATRSASKPACIKVSYDKYGEFGGRFGHLFYKDEFSHYRLRVEYRFVGQQATGGPDWALRNSGVMLHGEPIATMTRDQEFPDVD